MTTTVPSVILTNRMIIPIKAIDPEVIKKNYDRRIYDIKSCRRCEHRHERHSEYCDSCDSYKGHFVLYKKIVKNGKKYWSLPRAELYRLKDLGVKRYKIVNLMSRGTRLDKRLKITKEPYDYQKKCIKELVEGDGRKDYFPHGILKAAPRSGKCVTGDTIIHTRGGLLPIENLFDPNYKDGEITTCNIPVRTMLGKETITHKYKKTVDVTVLMETNYGTRLRGTPEHPVLVLTPTFSHKWKKMSELQVGDFVVSRKADGVQEGDFDYFLFGALMHCVYKGKCKQEGDLKYIIKARLSDFDEQNPKSTSIFNTKNFEEYAKSMGIDLSSEEFPVGIAQASLSNQRAFYEGTKYKGSYSGSEKACQMMHALVRQFDSSVYFNRESNFIKFEHYPEIKEYSTNRIRKDCIPYLGDFIRHVHYKHKKRKIKFTGERTGITLLSTHCPSYHLNLQKLKELDAKEYKKAWRVIDSNSPFHYEQVTEVKVVNETVPVYDITVPGSHSFIGNGLIVHNTLMSLTSAVKLRRKVLILANQEDLLKQFIIELTESTNIKDIDKFDGKVSFGMCSKVEDFEKYDVCLATYQTFISKKGKQKLKAIRKMFGTVFVDEAHRCAADAFSQVIDSFYAENRFGLTATDKRKDTLDFITRQILGDVVTEAKVKSLIPRVVVIPTGINPKHPYKTWNGAMQFLANNKDRTDLIRRWIKKDLKDGRKIVIPVMYKKQVHELVDLVRKMGYTAEAFIGGMKREELLKKARAGKIDVVVGIRSILATGVNVPCWSTIYTIAPISNAPNYYQETTRVCTPMDGKPEPIIRLFVDPLPMTKGCFRTCWTQTVLPMKYHYSDKTKEKAKEILSTMRSYKEDSDDEGFDSDGKVYRDASIFDVKTGKSKTKRIAKSNIVKKVQSIGLFKR